MHELSLFTGAGGGVLGTKLLGFRHIGYVEWDDYCQKVLAQRIKDGILDEAPIFSDVRAFASEGYAASYTGMVDVLSAGFPCQPFSVAGKQKGADDERNMWPATADVIRIVRPRSVLLENVPGIRPYLPVVIRDLRRLGYTVSRPLLLGADDCGAYHRRKRVWIFAYPTGNRLEKRGLAQRGPAGQLDGRCEIWNVAHSGGRGCGWEGGVQGCGENKEKMGETSAEAMRASKSCCIADVADTESREDNGRERRNMDEETGRGQSEYPAADACGEDAPDAQGVGLKRFRSCGEQVTVTHGRERLPLRNGGNGGEWPVEPNVGRVAHGVANRVDRLKALGNGQVPRVVATAWRLLNQ